MIKISSFCFWTYIGSITAAFLILHIIGVALKLYNKNKWFDIIIHFLSGCFIFTPLGFWLAYRNPSQSLWIATLFAFCFGGSVSALWEILEFIVDSIFKTNMQRWKDGTKFSIRGSGVIDIMGDIIANFAGSLIGCLILFPLLYLCIAF